MRLTTWNVNGIRNPFSYQPWNSARTFPAMFDILGSDIVVMQELKIQRKDLRDDMVLLDGWDCYFSLPKHKKGYSGIGMYTRNATCSPIRAEEGLLGVLPSPSGVPYCELPEEESIGGYPSAFQIAELGIDPAELDAEGRCLVLEFPAFVLLGVYSPANSNGMRDDFRYGFICSLDCRIRNLTRAGKRVVLVGDLNVSRDELDGASALEDIRKAAITHEEYISTPNRRIFNQLLIGGEVIGPRDDGREEGVLWDTTRGLHPYRKGMYTHWEQKINARPGNFGSRIDFVLVCESMQPWVKDANTQEGLLGSDHCPVYVDFHDTVQSHGNEVSLIDEMSPPGVFHDGARMKEWKVLDVPPFSGKRLPEFDKRRSIKSMFAAPSLRQPSSSALEPFIKPSSPVKQQAVADPAPANHDFPQLSSTAPESIGITASPALKRKASVSAKLKPSKRQKSDTPALAAKGQQSMKGFLSKGKANATELPTRTAGEEQQTNQRFTTPEPPATPTASAPSLPDTATTADQHPLPTTAPPSAPASPTPSTLSAFTDASPSSFTAHAASISATQKTWSTSSRAPSPRSARATASPAKPCRRRRRARTRGAVSGCVPGRWGPVGGRRRGRSGGVGLLFGGRSGRVGEGRRGLGRGGEGWWGQDGLDMEVLRFGKTRRAGIHLGSAAALGV